jgi:hypothetical protein
LFAEPAGGRRQGVTASGDAGSQRVEVEVAAVNIAPVLLIASSLRLSAIEQDFGVARQVFGELELTLTVESQQFDLRVQRLHILERMIVVGDPVG